MRILLTGAAGFIGHSVTLKLLEKGVYVIGFYFPVVPKDLARIRVQLSAGHTIEQLEKAINSFKEVGEELKII